MAVTLGFFLGKFTLTSAQATAALTVGGSAVNLTAGDYYLAGYSGESTAQFVEHVQVKIRALGASQDTSTVVYSPSTDRVTITLETAGTLAIDSATAAILGFTASPYSSGTSFVAEQSPRYTWSPSKAPSYHEVTAGVWTERIGTIYGATPDGTSWSLVRPTTYGGELQFSNLPASDVIRPSTGTVYEDLQTWLVDVVANGKPFRWVPNVAAYSSATSYQEAIWYDGESEEVGSILDYISRKTRSYLGFFSVKIPMAKKI